MMPVSVLSGRIARLIYLLDPVLSSISAGSSLRDEWITKSLLSELLKCSYMAAPPMTGIIQISDGNEVKYWFRSHHLSNDLGSSKFVFSDGREKIVSGYFCCEVMFSQKEFRSVADFESFLTKIDGISP